MSEIWKAVVGFEGLYEVSDQGRVRGLDRMIRQWKGNGLRLWRGRTLKQTVANNGYYMVGLQKNGKRSVRTIHSLVCEAFHGPAPAGHEVAHDNGKKLDCRALNLLWKTRVENHADKRRHGTHMQGESCPGAKLTEEKVKEARRRYSQGETQEAIAETLGCARRTAARAISGQSWAHV